MTTLQLSQLDLNLVHVDTNNKAVIYWLKASPSRVYKEHMIHYPVSELGELFVFLNTLHEQITVSSEVSQAFQNFQNKAEIVKRIKDGSITDFNLTTPTGFTGILHPYQQEVVAQMLLMHKCLLALAVGAGKTISSIFAALKLHEMTGANCLIVCEAGQIHKPWLAEIMKFTKGIQPLVIEGGADQKESLIRMGSQDRKKNWLWLCSYETIRLNKNIFPQTWDCIIADEVTKIKNVSTGNAIGLRALNGTYIYGLSGTPIMNSYFDLYGIMKFINPYIFTTKDNFAERYLLLDYFGNPKGILDGMEVELNSKLAPWVRQIAKKDMGKDKPIEMITYPVALTPKQNVELDSVLGEIASKQRTAFECGVNLRQICNTLRIVTIGEPVLNENGEQVFEESVEMPIPTKERKLFDESGNILDFETEKLLIDRMFTAFNIALDHPNTNIPELYGIVKSVKHACVRHSVIFKLENDSSKIITKYTTPATFANPLQAVDIPTAGELDVTLRRISYQQVDLLRKPLIRRILKYPDISIPESTNKLAHLKELVYDIVVHKKKKVVIFSFFKEVLELIKEELGEQYKLEIVTGSSKKTCSFAKIAKCSLCRKYKRCDSVKRIEYDFVEGDTAILAGTDTLSRAYNLRTCDVIINFDLPWSSGDLEQRIGRIDRDSNPAPKLYVYNLVTLGTIEERIVKIIEAKEYESSKLFPKYRVSLSNLSDTIAVEEIKS